MAMNLGYMELGGGGITARIYYDQTWLEVDPERNPYDAPLVNGPRGFCLDLTNLTGARQDLTIYGVGQTPLTIRIAQGDPVTSGPTSGRSRTAAQMASLGFTTRGNVGTIEIG